MAAPTLTAVTATTTGSTTSVTGSVPTGVVNNSVVLVIVITDTGTSITGLGTTGLVHAPGSPLLSASGGGNFNVNVLWKRSTGSEPGSYALTASAGIGFWAAGSARVDGAITSGSIWDANSGTGTALADSNLSGPVSSQNVSMTTGANDELLFISSGQFTGGTWTPPSGFNNDFTDTAAPGVLWFGDKAQATAGGTGTLTVSVSGSASEMCTWLGAIQPTGGATAVPWNPQRSVQTRDPGETWWIQKDRRNTLLVATAANDLNTPVLVPEWQRAIYTRSAYLDRRLVPQQPPLRGDMSLFAPAANDLAEPQFQPSDALYWHLYGDWNRPPARGQQRAYVSDPSLLTQVAPTTNPSPVRTIQVRDPGETWWQQPPRRDPSLLTTALLENELLGGAETAKRYLVPVTHDDRREVPQQRVYYDTTLLLTALLESPLLWRPPQPYIADRREVPQQRPYVSDPSFYPTVAPTDPLTLAWGAGGYYWHLYSDWYRPAEPAQQRRYVSDPLLLTTALLESPLLAGPPRQPLFTDRRSYPQQRVSPGPLGAPDADPLTLTSDTMRRVLTPAYADRREVPQQPRRVTLYFDAGPDSPPLTLSWGAGGNLWHTYNWRRPARSWWPAEFIFAMLSACSVPRPDTGTTTRPSTGTTVYALATTARPDTGTTTRPNTGTTEDPC